MAMARSYSLIARLALWHAAIGLVALGIGGILLYRTVNEVVWNEHRRSIMASASDITGRLQRDGVKGLSQPFPLETTRRFNSNSGSLMYVVLDPAGRQVGGSPGSERALPRFEGGREPAPVFRTGRDGSHVWGGSEVIRTPDGPLTIQVAQEMDRSYVVLDDVPAAALRPVMTVLGAGAVLLFLANVGLLLLMLRPLRAAAREAERIGHGGPPRLSRNGLPVEVAPLIDAVNGALDRLDDALEWQRGFSAEVAHELRTPLAVLHAELDLLGHDDVVARLKRDVQGLGQLVAELLEAAITARDPPMRDDIIDVVALAEEASRRIAAVAGAEGHDIRMLGAGGPVTIRGHGEAIGRALRNLMENAIAHSPAGAPVELRILPPRRGVVTIEVADRGSGVREEDMATIFRRHWRSGDTQRRGLGLGLWITERVVLAHGGSIAVRNESAGGAVFSIRLPVARQA